MVCQVLRELVAEKWSFLGRWSAAGMPWDPHICFGHFSHGWKLVWKLGSKNCPKTTVSRQEPSKIPQVFAQRDSIENTKHVFFLTWKVVSWVGASMWFEEVLHLVLYQIVPVWLKIWYLAFNFLWNIFPDVLSQGNAVFYNKTSRIRKTRSSIDFKRHKNSWYSYASLRNPKH